MRFVLKSVWILIATLGLSSAYANVSLRNGNFFVSYTDIVYPGGFGVEIERVYNSKSPFRGMFGWGWGTEYEVYLSTTVDGSVVVHEYGGGAENRFYPKGYDKSDLAPAVEKLTQAAKKSGFLGNTAQLKAYKDKLYKKPEFRTSEWNKFVKQKLMKPTQIKVGTKLVSNRFAYQSITRVKKGYVRAYDSGRVEYFDSQGKLRKISDPKGHFITFQYSKDGKIASLVDDFRRKMFFKFNSRGLLERIEGENKKVAAYKYNKYDELIYGKDVFGNQYRYRYSSDRRHNMTQIGYTDKTTMDVSYYPRNQKENVRSLKDRDGTVTTYSYKSFKKRPDDFAVSLTVKDKNGRILTKTDYEYDMKTKATGELYTYKLTKVIDGVKEETIYNECCGLPIVKTRNGQTTKFAYDSKGRVVVKDTPSERTRLRYHPDFGKIVRVDRYSKRDKSKTWSAFAYDKKSGNLVRAVNSDKQKVRLIYDLKGRIASMVDQEKRVIKFKYDANSKPIQITDPKLGSIVVKYSNSGEIASVDSSAGRRVAFQVTTAFQNLLDIIRPAGVTLAF